MRLPVHFRSSRAWWVVVRASRRQAGDSQGGLGRSHPLEQAPGREISAAIMQRRSSVVHCTDRCSVLVPIFESCFPVKPNPPCCPALSPLLATGFATAALPFAAFWLIFRVPFSLRVLEFPSLPSLKSDALSSPRLSHSCASTSCPPKGSCGACPFSVQGKLAFLALPLVPRRILALLGPDFAFPSLVA